MRVHRLIAILLLIESRGKMKANELAAALETSVRSIYRDIDTLAESGIPLHTATGPNGGISLMEGYTVNLRQLHGEEAVQLFLTGMGMPAGGSGETGLLLKNALLKLEASMPAPYVQDIRLAQNRFLFDDTPWWSERTVLPYLELLRTAVFRSKKLQVQYRKVNGETSHRKLRPYGLIVKQGEWYLAAYCERAEEVRTFKCERLADLELMDESYTVPDQFSLQKYWREGEQTFKAASKAREFYPVLMRISKHHSPKLLNGLDVLAMREDGEYKLVTVNMYDYETACTKALAVLAQAEIMEPRELREYIGREVDLWNKMYNGH